MSTADPCLWVVAVAADRHARHLDGADAVELAELLAFTVDTPRLARR